MVASEPLTNGYLSPNGHLSPPSRSGGSRSPSPLGLIPLHVRYRNFIHRHEIPRKLLHVSIGFITLTLYSRGVQAPQLAPWLLTAFVPIAAIDVVRHRSETVNKLYIRVVGALMRETEVSGYNGVMWYVLGAYAVLQFLPKDVGVLSILMVSWCDTAASTFGRLYGRHTMRLRHGKSLAGTLAAFCVGVFTAATFWGYVVPTVGSFPDDPEGAFMFTGRLNLFPEPIKRLIGWTADTSSAIISGPLALGVMSVVSGVVAAGSEFLDVFGWDDNLTIPVLSGFGIWGFLKVFG